MPPPTRIDVLSIPAGCLSVSDVVAGDVAALCGGVKCARHSLFYHMHDGGSRKNARASISGKCNQRVNRHTNVRRISGLLLAQHSYSAAHSFGRVLLDLRALYSFVLRVMHTQHTHAQIYYAHMCAMMYYRIHKNVCVGVMTDSKNKTPSELIGRCCRTRHR